MTDTGDGWCIECGDYFHYDDVGGYRPACVRCGLCRSCCECDSPGDGYDAYDDGEPPGAPGERTPQGRTTT